MFDPSIAADRLDRLWKLAAQFGTERGSNRIFLDEMVSDRLQLTAGLQLLRDELQFAPGPPAADRERARADLSLPSVVTTLAFTNCGDRIHQGEVDRYVQVVASRCKHVDPDALERGVGETLARRCATEERILVPVDGSSLSLVDRTGERGLGAVGTYEAGAVGLKVISALALTTDGVPLGLLRQVFWRRPVQRPTNRRPAKKRPIEKKETRHWLDAVNTSAGSHTVRHGTHGLTRERVRRRPAPFVVRRPRRERRRELARERLLNARRHWLEVVRMPRAPYEPVPFTLPELR